MSTISPWIVVFVGAVGALIAYCQWRIAQNKLKLDLFEKRLAAYEDFRDMFRLIQQSVDKGEQSWAFEDCQKLITLAYLLFDDEIAQRLSDITLRCEHDIWLRNHGQGDADNQQRKAATLKLLSQEEGEMFAQVIPFLRIRHQVFPWSPFYRWGRITAAIKHNEVKQFYFDKIFHQNRT